MESIREFLGKWVRRGFSPLLAGMERLGITPNHITVVAFLINLAAAVLVGFGYYIWAASIFIVASLLDLVDGSLARRTGKTTPFGSFLDSTLDRLSEGAMFAAIAYRLAIDTEVTLQMRGVNVALVVLALLGSVTVSYTRARAESLGVECRVGLASRFERIFLICTGLYLVGGDLWPEALPYVIYVIVVLTMFTVVQRVVHTYHQLRQKEEQGGIVERQS
jgi:CDP-diacylglycerol---glycerol-3-phosphate 3-phosphatidyltransferase